MVSNNWLGPPEGSEIEVDEPTRRLGLYLAVGFAAQFFAHLVGIGVREGIRVEVLHPIFIAAALALRAGRSWGRTVFKFVGAVAAFGAMLLTLFAIVHPLAMLPMAVIVDALVFVFLVAVAFTIERLGPAWPFPPEWRSWATSPGVHVLILVLLLLGVFRSGF